MTRLSQSVRGLVQRLRKRFPLASDATRAFLASIGAFTVMIAVLVIAPELLVTSRRLSGWVAYMIAFGVCMFGAYVALTLVAFSRLDPATLTAVIRKSESRRNPRLERWLAADQMSWILTAAGFALVLVALTVLDNSLRSNAWALAGAALLVVLSWLLMAVAASVHLMRLDVDGEALRFPDETPRTFSDYFYVATIVFATFATSDVSATSTKMRRSLTAMSISALAFNTVVVALLVSGVLTLATG